ncbi:MAG: peptidase M14 [Phycisphaerae bacterium]|nr:peptidase M14 [Phycisphaerae bacterium]
MTIRVSILRRNRSAAALALGCLLVAAGAWAQTPAAHVYPALGVGAVRKVDVAWNRFYDHAGLADILARLHQAFPDLTKLYSLGKSTEGRDLWCIEVTTRNVGNPDRKPGMYVSGNIHGNEVQAGEMVAYTAWYLCHQHGRLDRVTSLLDDYVFYLVPMVNPDGRDFWLADRNGALAGRTGSTPIDNDRDGVADEDDCDDLDGDGCIAMMRIKDPQGREKPHPDYPQYMMVRARPDEPGEYTVLGWEGIDNDGDGRINEDGRGGYDLNRNWAWDWQPAYVQHGAMDYPFSQPETRAVANFALAHPNIAACQCYHNCGGMILRGPGREGGEMKESDARLLQNIAEQGEKILPYYRSMICWQDLYTTWGDEDTWFYGARGILAYTCEMWTSQNLYKTDGDPSREQEAEFIRHVLLGDGVVAWRPYDHPTYGRIEIGGLKKEWGRLPPSFLLEEELHRNMAFAVYHAGMMPRLRIADVAVEPLGNRLCKVWVTVENSRPMPTRTGQDRDHHISPPDLVSIRGGDLRVLSSGLVTNRFFKQVQAVEYRPERVELDTIDGMEATRVQFIVQGSGSFTVTVDSAKGGLLRKDGSLP